MVDSGTARRNDGAFRVQFDWSSTPPAVAVVETVAAETETEPTELPPLYESVDSDALNALVGEDGKDVTVSFLFEERHITVHGQGEVVVRKGETAD